ncbi:MAG TPA: thioredoxin domain-containing protein, partial [Candidatus Acidoferrales bacterium]
MSEQSPNRLASSASPYLRSAAHQPVQWFEWGEEAFARARAEDKPILLDIGAVWCHWCHVIDRESYEDPELAALINRLFIPVKVDRDERPDVDARYQTAVSAVSGQGGWPLTGFLLPDGRPFYGGTYFPPQEAMGRPSFRRVLEQVAAAYGARRDEIERAATGLMGAVAQAELFDGAHAAWDARLLEQQAAAMVERFDPRHGGFSHAPKFPHSGALDFLLQRHQATGDARLLHIVQTTLEHMARGGVYDQLGGGFHRYSVDERWLVPHFEKMSYDNSELLKNFLHGYQAARSPLLRQTAEGIVDWVNGVLSDREHGGFYASQDADVSLDDDGDYFTWTQEEVRAALPAEQARVIELYYDVGPAGEMHHNPAKNVLWVAREPEEIAKALGVSQDEVKTLLEKARAQLLVARAKRQAPFVDTTLYTGWNAMFVSAYLEAASVLDDWRGAACHAFALRTLDRFLAEGWDDTRGFTHRLGAEWLYGSL